jgi:hypothetical protein
LLLLKFGRQYTGAPDNRTLSSGAIIYATQIGNVLA